MRVSSPWLRTSALLIGLLLCAALSANTAYAEPKYGGTMVISLGGDPGQLNCGISSSMATAIPAAAILEGLISQDGSLAVVPALAESWEIQDGGKRFIFHLRRGVVWHDGEPFTSADVVYTLQHITPLHPRATAVFQNVIKVEALDQYTVAVQLREVYGPFLSFLTVDNVPILPKHIYEGSDPRDNPANLAPIGTGPFKFKSWDPGRSVTLVKNDKYWRKGRPYLDSLVFSISPDANARGIALETGETDMLPNYYLSMQDVARFKSNPNLQIFQGPGNPLLQILFFNNKNTYLQTPAVRKALYRAIDRSMIVDSAFAGMAKEATSAIPPDFKWAYDPKVDYKVSYAFDPKRANQELDAAGFPRDSSGTRFSLRFTFDPAENGFLDTADIIRENLAALGIKLILEPRERNVWMDNVYVKKDFDMTIAMYTAGNDPAIGIDRTYQCSDVRPVPFTNASQYCNHDIDNLLLSARTTVEPAKRAEYYGQMQEIIEKDMPSAPLVEILTTHVFNKRVKNIQAAYPVAREPLAQYGELYIDQ